jgi:hypothetical protein
MLHLFIKYKLTIVFTKLESIIKHVFIFELGISQLCNLAHTHRSQALRKLLKQCKPKADNQTLPVTQGNNLKGTLALESDGLSGVLSSAICSLC